jgi:hypothetical protein
LSEREAAGEDKCDRFGDYGYDGEAEKVVEMIDRKERVGRNDKVYGRQGTAR